MASVHDTSEDNPVWLLNHRTRRRIILAIGDAGRVSASALRASLQISTGSLYYNLKQLEPFVAQDSKRNYYLTEKGLEVYKMLKAGDPLLLENVKNPQSFFDRLFTTVIHPSWILGPALDRAIIAVILGSLSALLNMALYLNGKISLIGLHVYHWRNFDLGSTILTMLGTIFFIYIYLSALTGIYDEFRKRRILGKQEDNTLRHIKDFILNVITFNRSALKGLAAVCIGILPMSLYPFLLFIAKVKGWTWVYAPGSVVPTSLAANIVLVSSQFISFLLLTSSLSHLRSIRWHIAALISLSLIYLSIVLQYVILGVFTPQG
ncbi:MAG: helix-turn-helix domain-containing protein [Nitrososphaerota archaeon]